MRRVWYPGHLGRAIGLTSLCLVVAGAFVLSDRDHAQRNEISRLSSTCPPAQAGEQLAATVQSECGSGGEELRCVYISTSGYGRIMRSRPAAPGGSS
ncbi:hypothetical protein [Nitrosovibrio sp. Nv4]|uniref:hypothetical protein n=1 Tax=Nitrosovibrio sp. Nv4 TaxID=1945880 RepID=UPI000BDD6531|nr:hypothetical protein [Nitrosovibrio sp. Nv4]SOD42301.1 hypothetical protein SAMN06298226_2639 [Nitrosovibrio sp. Nv4]